MLVVMMMLFSSRTDEHPTRHSSIHAPVVKLAGSLGRMRRSISSSLMVTLNSLTSSSKVHQLMSQNRLHARRGNEITLHPPTPPLVAPPSSHHFHHPVLIVIVPIVSFFSAPHVFALSTAQPNVNARIGSCIEMHAVGCRHR